MEGQAEQTALATARDERAHVEKRRRPDHGTVEDLDAPGLLDDEQAPRAVAGVDETEWEAEPGGDRLEAEDQLRLCMPSGDDDDCGGEQQGKRRPSRRSG